MQRVFAIALGLFCGLALFAIGWGLSSSRTVAFIVAVFTALAVAALWIRKPLLPLEASAAPQALKWIGALSTLAALIQVGRLTVFMIDPTAVGYSSLPSSGFEVHHSCVSSYFCAIEAIDTHPNIYDEDLYGLPTAPGAPRQGKFLGTFRIDQYEYPPPFLLLTRALHWLAPTFLEHRALWYGLNLLILIAAMLMTAHRFAGTIATRAVLFLPLIFAAIPTLSTLQKGNVQFVVIALAMVAMLCFARGRNAVGGLLLAYTIVSKLYPGMLVIYLLVRRQWSALIWTCAMALLLIVVSVADVGIEPYKAFVEHFPRLLGGEAFAALRNPGAMAINLSIPGLIFKLKLFDVPGMGFAAAKAVGWVYTIVAVGLTVLMARRVRTEREGILASLAILTLATLRSPFLPQTYAVFPALWLLTLVAAVPQPNARRLSATMALCVALYFFFPIDMFPPRTLALIMLLPQAVLTALPIYVLLRLQRLEAFSGETDLQSARA